MVNIFMLVAVLLAFALGAFTGAKCIQLGLKYQMQVSKGVEPKLEPIKPIVEAVQTARENRMTNTIYDELMNGGGDPI